MRLTSRVAIAPEAGCMFILELILSSIFEEWFNMRKASPGVQTAYKSIFRRTSHISNIYMPVCTCLLFEYLIDKGRVELAEQPR